MLPSTARTMRDPNNFSKAWRGARDELDVPGIIAHSFRKTVATLINGEGLSARIGADHPGPHPRLDDASDTMTRCPHPPGPRAQRSRACTS